jgi:hypothetical protein
MKQETMIPTTTSGSTSNRAATISMMLVLPWDSNIAFRIIQDNAAGRSSSQLALVRVPGTKPLCRWAASTSRNKEGDRFAKTEASQRSINPPKRPLRRCSWAVEAVATNDECGSKQCIENAPESVTDKMSVPPPDRLSPTPLEGSRTAKVMMSATTA